MIFGAGVIGSIYAVKLSLAGHSVSVLARNTRLKELKFIFKILIINDLNIIFIENYYQLNMSPYLLL